ncbi:MAG: DUF3078 domain-containing protein [Bacteroidota bacterium]|nr:DUF3078 domain-containing protein [Bacteroidota bacterium]
MKNRIALCLIFCAVPIAAQEKPVGETEHGWKNTLVAGMNLTQVSLHNWMQGGESTIAWALFTTGKFAYSGERYRWTNGLKATYGQAKVGERDVEKTDDELFVESILAYRLGWPIDPYLSVSLRTQCAPGYKTVDGVRTQTSGFFDPGYLIESAGFAYQPSEYFATRLGVAVKETFTSSFTRFGYTGDPGKKTRVQTGIESGTSAKYPVMENILYTSQLNLFSAFEHLDVWDVRWDNTLSAKVNAYVNVSLNVLLVHEIAQTRRTQVKEALALGLTYTLL